jgi:Flp pilus assembly protein TadD
VAREDAEATTLLGKGADSDPALTPWVLARYWLLSRNTSADAAVKFLAQVGKKHGGALLVHSLEASALGAMNEHARAVKAWNEYLALSPTSAFAQGRLSHSLARQGKVDLALAAAQKGLALAPESREARLALAARQLDAKKLDDAKATLQPLVSLPNAPAEPALQLGLAYWAAGDSAAAQPLFKVASERAVGPRAWKTKGHALYALALVEAKAGHADAAKTLYSQSQDTGFTVTPVDPLLTEVVAAMKPHVVTPPVAAVGGLYLNVPALEPTAPQGALAQTVLHEKLTTLGAQFAPEGEAKPAAVGVIKTRKLKGYELRVKVLPAEADGLKVEMLVMSYPEQALKGSWSVKASGAKPEALVKAMIARVVDDAASDLDWK